MVTGSLLKKQLWIKATGHVNMFSIKKLVKDFYNLCQKKLYFLYINEFHFWSTLWSSIFQQTELYFFALFHKLISGQKFWAFYIEVMKYPLLYEKSPILSRHSGLFIFLEFWFKLKLQLHGIPSWLFSFFMKGNYSAKIFICEHK